MKFLVTFVVASFAAASFGTQLPQWVIKWKGEEAKLRETATGCTISHLFDNYYQIDAPTAADELLVSHIQAELEIAAEAKSLERQNMEPKDLTYLANRKSDPKDVDQWYLFKWPRDKQPVPTMNVLQAWNLTYSGKGVTVAVVDQGINNNTEFENRLVRAAYNITSDSTPPKSHGTNVAGVIGAARGNMLCGTGIAPAVTLLDIKVMPNSGTSSSSMEQFALRPRHGHNVDIFHNSWTATSTGAYIYTLTDVVRDAIAKGVVTGRGGKGSIYVFSAGNGGTVDGCAYDGYLNNRHVIVVSGVSRNLTRLGTGEACSAVMVTAYSSDRSAEEKNPIVTPDGEENGCTDTFGRSSAASPMVSGAIALALEANPRLTWRDIQHLLVNTSRPHLNFSPNDFATNGAGNKVSPTFGFGLLDIGKLVSKAETWKPNALDPETSCSFELQGYRKLEKGNQQGWQFDFMVRRKCNINTLERVEVKIKGAFKVRGELKASLKSPMGTHVTLLKGRPFDFFQSSLDLTVSAVSFWDEKSKGLWVLQLEDLDKQKRNDGSLTMVELRLYGQGNGIPFTKTMPQGPRTATSTTSSASTVTPATTQKKPTSHPLKTTTAAASCY